MIYIKNDKKRYQALAFPLEILDNKFLNCYSATTARDKS
jgi:hypothetical protein